MNHDVKAVPAAIVPPCSRVWMGYFVFTIFAVGAPLSVAFCIPLYLLSFFFPWTQRPADWVLRWGIGLLMRVQPWFVGDCDIQIPKGGVLLASNHRSHLDAFILLSRVQGIRILAKSTLFYIPCIGIMMKLTGQIPTQRGEVASFWKAMAMIREKLRDGQTVHVFPEMTRCTPGFSGTNDFMAAPFLAAKEAGRPVVPVVFENTDGAWPRGEFALRPRQNVRVRTLAPLDPAAFATADELCRETRRRINEALA